jgi:hypothetical protein
VALGWLRDYVVYVRRADEQVTLFWSGYVPLLCSLVTFIGYKHIFIGFWPTNIFLFPIVKTNSLDP